jgi:CRP-like cAMP-binding protein
MNIINSIKLESRVISEITKISQKKKFLVNSTLYYENQIPIAAYLLVEGCIHLLKNKKIKKILKPGSLIGLNELIENSPSKISAQVQADSTLYFLDKSTLIETLKLENSELSIFLNQYSEFKTLGERT